MARTNALDEDARLGSSFATVQRVLGAMLDGGDTTLVAVLRGLAQVNGGSVGGLLSALRVRQSGGRGDTAAASLAVWESAAGDSGAAFDSIMRRCGGWRCVLSQNLTLSAELCLLCRPKTSMGISCKCWACSRALVLVSAPEMESRK